jgi:hypothetical protein
MGVSWSDQAEADLRNIDPTVRRQIKRNAELPEVVHHIPPRNYPADEGHYGGIMWHRAISHGRPTQERSPEQGNGPLNYFLLYRSQRRNPPEFEIQAVRSLGQVASMWVQMTKGPE